MRSNLGFLFAELGDFERAEEALRPRSRRPSGWASTTLATAVLHNLGHVLGLRGDLDEARRLEQRAVDSFVEQGDPRMEGVARTYLAEILVAAGDLRGRRRRGAARGRSSSRRARCASPRWPWSRARCSGRGASPRATCRRARRPPISRSSARSRRARRRCAWCWSNACEQSGACEEARGALAEARAWLLARAARISEPSWRTRFMNDVPTNAKLLASGDARSF